MLRVIPVMDLKGGQVVRGIAGRRAEYLPIRSKLVADAAPRNIARAIARLGFAEAYVADLDAIEGGQPAWDVYCAVAACGLELWIDAGIATTARARQLARMSGEHRVTGIVAGLESLPEPSLLVEWLAIAGPDRLIVSLDLRDGRPITQIESWRNWSAESIGRAAIDLGVRRLIVLDLARVGVGQGAGTEQLCRALRDYSPDIELTAGGGVRGPKDLDVLAQAGCDAALVASALHDGRLGSLTNARSTSDENEPIQPATHDPQCRSRKATGAA
jgi:phosphoribosylformimino-5-aminoimidazole carboxamide ribotide isomerase